MAKGDTHEVWGGTTLRGLTGEAQSVGGETVIRGGPGRLWKAS